MSLIKGLKLKINYSKSVEELVKAGKYAYVNSDITSDIFPSSESGTANLEAVIFEPKGYSSSEGILKEMETVGLKPATLKELLEFGIKYPKEQLKHYVVALGSVWRYPFGGRHVPYLWGYVSERRLDLLWFDSSWDQDDRFLACKVSRTLGTLDSGSLEKEHKHLWTVKELVCSCGEVKSL